MERNGFTKDTNVTVGVKKLTANEVIVQLLSAINSGQKDSFYRVLENYKNTLSPTGEMYYKLSRLLMDKPKHIVQLSELSNDIRKLFIQQEGDNGPVYLNEKTRILIDDLLAEWSNAELFHFHNLRIRNKILLHGPTGNGKTTIARHIATLTGLPFIEVNADLVIDSRIGNTGANINKIFNQVNMPCVIFWDEVDSIGRIRGNGGDAAGMENERMVNSVLINIDKLNQNVIFIGATNRREVLDVAFLRRFDVELELGQPSIIEKEMFAKQLIAQYKLPITEFRVAAFENLSQIKLDLIDRARKYVLTQVHFQSEGLQSNMSTAQ